MQPILLTPEIVTLIARFKRARKRWTKLIRLQQEDAINRSGYFYRFEQFSRFSDAMWADYRAEAKRQGWKDSEFYALPTLA
jgi:hypothetical protein